MENKNAVVVLGLEDSVLNRYRADHSDYKELRKIWDKGDLLESVVGDVCMSMVRDVDSDELNPVGYDENQRELANYIKDFYNDPQNREDGIFPPLLYKGSDGSVGYMEFDSDISDYKNAFISGSQEVSRVPGMSREVGMEELRLKVTKKKEGGRN
jgi:hypothetical protein